MARKKLPHTIRVGKNCRVTLKSKPETDEIAILAFIGNKMVGDTYEDRRDGGIRHARGTAAATVRWLRKQPQCRR